MLTRLRVLRPERKPELANMINNRYSSRRQVVVGSAFVRSGLGLVKQASDSNTEISIEVEFDRSREITCEAVLGPALRF